MDRAKDLCQDCEDSIPVSFWKRCYTEVDKSEVWNMAQTNISFEMNDKLASRMEDVCEDLGLTMEEAFQIFANRMVREDGIPFEVKEEDYPRDDKETLVKKVLKISAAVLAVAALIKGISCLIRHFSRDRK